MAESVDEDSLREYRRRRRRERGWLRTLRHRLRPWITRPLMRLNLALFPTLYLLYMRFVWATSRIVDHGLGRLFADQRRAQRRGGAALARGGGDGRLGLRLPGLPPAHAGEPLERRRGDHAPARALRLRGVPGRLERPRFPPGLERDPGADRPHAQDRRRDLRPDRRRLEGPCLPAQARRGRDRARLRPADRAGPHLVPALHPPRDLGPHRDPAALQPHPLLHGGAVLRARRTPTRRPGSSASACASSRT